MSVVIITGCSSGFGLGAAVGYAAAGDKVYATMRTPSKQGDLRAACDAAGVAVEVIPLDVTDDASVAAAVRTVVDTEGRIDVLVNNAGVGYLYAIETMPDALLRETFETNVFGMLRTTRAVLPTMRSQGSGTIINVGSVSGHIPVPFTGFYPATKHALRTISEALSMEVEPLGIKVSLVEAGFFRTNILADQAAHPIDPNSPYFEGETKTREFWESSVANGRDPAEVIDLIVSLGRNPSPPLHSLIDHDQWIPARFANDDAGWSTLMKSVVGY